MLYRAVNTMDSMIGHKNEKYLYFGWASARLDDLLNYLPARIAGMFLVLAALVLGLDWKNAWKTILRDAGKHSSPNSGIPEAAVAGALGIRLGGTNFYSGRPEFRGYLGEDRKPIDLQQAHNAIRLMYLSSGLFVLFELSFACCFRLIG